MNKSKAVSHFMLLLVVGAGGPGLGLYRHGDGPGAAAAVQRRLAGGHLPHPVRVAVPVRHHAGHRRAALTSGPPDGARVGADAARHR